MTSPTTGAPGPAGRPAGLGRRLASGLVLALAVYLALALYGDLRQLPAELRRFPWQVLPLVLALTLVNYVGRWVKWHWYLGLVDARLSWRDSGRIFGAGMTMVLTPGKVGEFLKCYMVRQVAGTPMAVTAPIVVAERLSDGFALLALAAVGLWSFPEPGLRLAALGVLGGLLAVLVVVHFRPLALRLLALAERLPVVGRFAESFEALYLSSTVLLSPRNLLIAVLIGIVSWTGEGLAYYVVLLGFGVPPGLTEALHAVFIFSVSTIVGAVVATPGGLGATEASLVALSRRAYGLDRTTATAAAMVIRFCTLWFGVAIGLACLLRWPELLTGLPDTAGDAEIALGPPAAGTGDRCAEDNPPDEDECPPS
jgi:uncharacterized protein (TIRG00374 family)